MWCRLSLTLMADDCQQKTTTFKTLDLIIGLRAREAPQRAPLFLVGSEISKAAACADGLLTDRTLTGTYLPTEYIL